MHICSNNSAGFFPDTASISLLILLFDFFIEPYYSRDNGSIESLNNKMRGGMWGQVKGVGAANVITL